MIKKLIVVIPMFLVVIKANSQNVGINDNGNNPNPSAMLDIDSQSKGLLIPRLTTIERDAINNPVEALMIYNKDTECYEGYNANIQKWQSFGCIDCRLPNVSVATAGTNINTISFDANWNASANATTYYIDVSDDAGFSNLIINNLNVGNVLTYNVSGLTCNIDYYYRVRAENACGTTGSSNVEMLTTAFCWSYALCGGGIMTFNDVTNPNTGKTWMDRNLGASQVAASSTDANSYGDLFQWGREADGHQCRNSSTTSTRSSSDSPGHGNFITNSLSPYDWRTQQNNNLWQGVNGT